MKNKYVSNDSDIVPSIFGRFWKTLSCAGQELKRSETSIGNSRSKREESGCEELDQEHMELNKDSSVELF